MKPCAESDECRHTGSPATPASVMARASWLRTSAALLREAAGTIRYRRGACSTYADALRACPRREAGQAADMMEVMVTENLRVGCLGAARIVPMALARPANKVDGIELAAVAARDPQ